jgi:hypothetical protein
VERPLAFGDLLGALDGVAGATGFA